jgi:aspartate racemase
MAKYIIETTKVNSLGLMATSGTIAAGRFKQVLAKAGLGSIEPEPPFQALVMEGIYCVKSDNKGQKRGKCREKFQAVANHLVVRGAQGIIAGCTEIPLVIKASDLDVPFFDPLIILAEAAVREALS